MTDDDITYDEMLAIEIDDFELLEELLDEDPSRVWDDKVKTALANAKIKTGNDMYSRFVSSILRDLKTLVYLQLSDPSPFRPIH